MTGNPAACGRVASNGPYVVCHSATGVHTSPNRGIGSNLAPVHLTGAAPGMSGDAVNAKNRRHPRPRHPPNGPVKQTGSTLWATVVRSGRISALAEASRYMGWDAGSSARAEVSRYIGWDAGSSAGAKPSAHDRDAGSGPVATDCRGSGSTPQKKSTPRKDRGVLRRCKTDVLRDTARSLSYS